MKTLTNTIIIILVTRQNTVATDNNRTADINDMAKKSSSPSWKLEGDYFE